MTLKKATWRWRGSRAWPEVSAGLVGLAVLSYAWPVAGRGMWEIQSAVLGLLLAVISSWAFFRWSGRNPGCVSPMLAPLLVLSGWMLLSVLWSPDRVSGFESALLFLWISVIAGQSFSRPSPALLVRLVVGLALVECLAGMFQAGMGPISRQSGTFISATHHAVLLMAGFSVTAVIAYMARGMFESLLAQAASLIFLSSAALSGSRAVVPAALAVLLVLLLSRPAGARRWPGRILLALSIAALLAPSGISRRVADQLAGREPMPLGRLDLWGACARMLEANPVCGTGIGGFADRYFSVRPESLAGLTAEYAHSEPLQVACETGVVGLGLLVWIGLVIWRLRPAFKRQEPVVLAAAMPLVPLAVYSLVDFPMRVPVLAFLAVSIISGWMADVRRPDPGSGIGGRYPAVSYALVSVLMAGWLCAGHLAAVRYLAGADLVSEGKTSEAIGMFESALEIFPFHAESLHAIAELDPSADGSREKMARASGLRPSWMPPVVTSFELALEADDGEGAESALKRGTDIDPQGMSTMLMKARWLAWRKEWGAAEKQVNMADKKWPGQLDVLMGKARLYEARGDVDGCRNVLRKILAVFPHNITVKAWLERLSR